MGFVPFLPDPRRGSERRFPMPVRLHASRTVAGFLALAVLSLTRMAEGAQSGAPAEESRPAPAPATAAGAAAADPNLQQAERRLAEARAMVSERPEVAEGWTILLMAQTMLTNQRGQLAAGGAPVDAEALAAQHRAETQSILADWKQARPMDAMPYLVTMQGEVPAERQDDYVLGLVERFPDDPKLLARVAQILNRREQSQRAAQLVDAALERHPERSEMWAVALRCYSDQRNAARQSELSKAWIERMPTDSAALRNWLASSDAGHDPKTAAALVEGYLAVAALDAGRVETCGWLLPGAHGAYRETAQRCLEDAAANAGNAALRQRAATLAEGSLPASGDLEAFARAVERLPSGQRHNAVLTAADALQPEDCATRMRLLRMVPWGTAAVGGGPGSWFRPLSACATYPAARDSYLAAFSTVKPADLQPLI